MTKHTAGEWRVGGKDKTIVYAGDGYAVASCAVYHGRFKDGEAEANARLIAASPELLEALILCLDDMRSAFPNYDHYESDSYNMASAAIAKATGEE